MQYQRTPGVGKDAYDTTYAQRNAARHYNAMPKPMKRPKTLAELEAEDKLPTQFENNYAQRSAAGKSPRCALCTDLLPVSPWNVKPPDAIDHVKLCHPCAQDYFDRQDEARIDADPELAEMDAHLRSISRCT